MTTGLQRVASLSEVPLDTNKAFQVADLSVLVCHTSKGVFAVRNLCTHQKAPLEGGRIKSCYLFCPKHSVRFDLQSGKPAGTLTTESLDTYRTSIVDGDIFVDTSNSN